MNGLQLRTNREPKVDAKDLQEKKQERMKKNRKKLGRRRKKERMRKKEEERRKMMSKRCWWSILTIVTIIIIIIIYAWITQKSAHLFLHLHPHLFLHLFLHLYISSPKIIDADNVLLQVHSFFIILCSLAMDKNWWMEQWKNI